MKKYIISAAIAIALIFIQNNLIAQSTNQPDSILKPIQDLSWFPKGTAFASFNGETYMFVWTDEQFGGDLRWYPYVYKASNGNFVPFTVNNSNKLEFHYKHEEDVGYCIWTRVNVEILGNAFAFTYAGQLWYYCLIKHPPYPGYFPGTYYELWARYENSKTGWATWYDEIQDKPTRWKLGACEVDSLLRIVSWDDVAGKLVTEDYMYNSATRKLDYKAPVSIDLPGEWVGGLISYKDSENQNCMIYNTFTEGDDGFLSCVSPSFSRYDEHIGSSGATRMIMGSAQGKYNTVSYHPEEGRRFNIFRLRNDKNGHGGYDLWDLEYIIPANHTAHPYLASSRDVTLPSTNTPQKCGGYWEMGISNVMIPGEFSKEIPGLDGLSEKLQVYYSDNGNNFYGAFFNSDVWRPVDKSTVQSMEMTDDSLYGPGIRDLWTLVGITDGAPPCAIDWSLWEEWHFAEDATALKFKVNNSSSSKVTSSFEDAYSLGGKIETKFSKLIGFEASFKYANSYKSMVASSREVSAYLETNFALNESSQDLAYYIYAVPQIARTSYKVYPWWDSQCLYPITNSLQYQFRTIGMIIQTENHEISEFPFIVGEPNDPDLTDFKSGHRSQMFNESIWSGVQPLGTMSYTSPNPGGGYGFDADTTVTESTEVSNTYSWSVGSTVTIPEVFKISASYDQDISYSAEYEFETKFGVEVDATLENLTDGEKFGIQINSYDMSIYWFRPADDAYYWYYDSLDGQKPWYIGYIVGSVSQHIYQLYPADASELKASDIMFSWKTDGVGLSDYTLFISRDPHAGPGSTIHKITCGKNTSSSLKDFAAETGKTYYWSVRGMTADGEPVWSDSRAFTVGEDQPGGSPSLLKASIYPNPGKIADIRIIIDPGTEGKIMVRLTDINGAMVAAREIFIEDGMQATVSFPGLNLPTGIYLAVITTGQGQVVKKVIVR